MNKLLERILNFLLDDAVCIQELHKLVVLKSHKFNAQKVTLEIIKLYFNVKVLGIEKTKCWMIDEKGRKLIIRGNELPVRMRALAIQVIVQLFRMDDSDFSLGRLQKHFKLDNSIKAILGDTKIFGDYKSNQSGLPVISINDTYERLLETA